MKKISYLPMFIVACVLQGCGQINQSNEHLGSMDATSKQMLLELKSSRESLALATKQSERIADALVALKDLSVDLVKVLQATFAKKPAEKTDDIDSVIGPNS